MPHSIVPVVGYLDDKSHRFLSYYKTLISYFERQSKLSEMDDGEVRGWINSCKKAMSETWHRILAIYYDPVPSYTIVPQLPLEKYLVQRQQEDSTKATKRFLKGCNALFSDYIHQFNSTLEKSGANGRRMYKFVQGMIKHFELKRFEDYSDLHIGEIVSPEDRRRKFGCSLLTGNTGKLYHFLRLNQSDAVNCSVPFEFAVITTDLLAVRPPVPPPSTTSGSSPTRHRPLSPVYKQMEKTVKVSEERLGEFFKASRLALEKQDDPIKTMHAAARIIQDDKFPNSSNPYALLGEAAAAWQLARDPEIWVDQPSKPVMHLINMVSEFYNKLPDVTVGSPATKMLFAVAADAEYPPFQPNVAPPADTFDDFMSGDW